MKWLFLLMVAVNIAIYVWGLQRETQNSTALDPRYRNIGEIKLLTTAEIESPDIEPSSENNSIGEPVTNPEQQIGSEENISVMTAEAAASHLPKELAFPDGGEEGAIASATPLEEDREPSDTTTPPGVTASEATNEVPMAQAEESVVANAGTGVVPEMFCWTLGPIDQRSAALTILESVEKKVDSAALREEPKKNITGYWVILPPYENAGTANKVVEQLKARDVIDVQRFYRGEFQNGVSLGVYNQRFNAEKRKAQIENKGFSPEVLPRYKELLRYWVDYRGGNEVDVLEELPYGYRDLAVSSRACDDQTN